MTDQPLNIIGTYFVTPHLGTVSLDVVQIDGAHHRHHNKTRGHGTREEQERQQPLLGVCGRLGLMDTLLKTEKILIYIVYK